MAVWNRILVGLMLTQLCLPVSAQSTPELPPSDLPQNPLDCSQPIDLDRALDRGLAANPGLRAAQARVRASYWAYQKASSLPAAQLTLATIAGSNVPGSQPGGNNPSGAGAGFATFAANGRTDTYLQFTQPFLPFGAQADAQRVAAGEFQASELAARDLRVILRQQIKDAFYTLLAAQATQNAARDNLQLAEQSHQIARRRLEAGAGPKLDLVDAGVQLSRAQQDLVRAESSLHQAQVILAGLLAVDTGRPLVVRGALEQLPVADELEQLSRQALDSPKLRAARVGVERAQAMVDLAESQSNPNPTFSFVRDLATHTYQVQVGLQFSLDWGQLSAEVDSKKQNLEEQRQNQRATELGLSSALRVASEQYAGATRNAAEFREKILLPSEESTRITQYGFQRGAVAYVRLLTSQQNLTAVRKEYIGLLLSAWLALDAVEAATGQGE
jgi:outer membrane protein TolC